MNRSNFEVSPSRYWEIVATSFNHLKRRGYLYETRKISRVFVFGTEENCGK